MDEELGKDLGEDEREGYLDNRSDKHHEDLQDRNVGDSSKDSRHKGQSPQKCTEQKNR